MNKREPNGAFRGQISEGVETEAFVNGEQEIHDPLCPLVMTCSHGLHEVGDHSHCPELEEKCHCVLLIAARDHEALGGGPSEDFERGYRQALADVAAAAAGEQSPLSVRVFAPLDVPHPEGSHLCAVTTEAGENLCGCEDLFTAYQLENSSDVVFCHPAEICAQVGAGGSCAVHRRSSHFMRGWRQSWNSQRLRMERVCSHGVGHLDPDDVLASWTFCGCAEGCCTPPSLAG